MTPTPHSIHTHKEATMKTVAIACLAAAIATSASAADLTIAAGKAGRGYDKRAQQIAQKMGGMDVLNLSGSDDITRAVCDGRAHFGIAQIDALFQRAQEGCALFPIAAYPAQEYAMILFPEGSKKSSLHDLGPEDTVLVDKAGSGTSLYWDTIVIIERGDDGNKSSWSSAKTVNAPLEFASAMANANRVDAVVIVTDPKSPQLLKLIAEGWNPGEFDDKDINDKTWNGAPLYTKATVKIDTGGWLADSEDAYVVRSFFVAREDFVFGDGMDDATRLGTYAKAAN